MLLVEAFDDLDIVDLSMCCDMGKIEVMGL